MVPVGVYQETDFVEALYQPVLERAIGRNRGEEDRIEEVVRSAFDLMKECVAKRGIELCRYVGPDENASVLKQQHPVRTPREEQDIFRYIDKSADISMSILPHGNMSGGGLSINDLDSPWS